LKHKAINTGSPDGALRLQHEPATDSENVSEFGRFKDLTEKLVQVPKKELDEKRGKRQT
jgi:hypothetical protein